MHDPENNPCKTIWSSNRIQVKLWRVRYQLTTHTPPIYFFQMMPRSLVNLTSMAILSLGLSLFLKTTEQRWNWPHLPIKIPPYLSVGLWMACLKVRRLARIPVKRLWFRYEHARQQCGIFGGWLVKAPATDAEGPGFKCSLYTRFFKGSLVNQQGMGTQHSSGLHGEG